MSTHTLCNYLDGKFVASESEELLDVRSPHDRQVVRRIPASTAEDVRTAVECGAAAFLTWSVLPAKDRAAKLQCIYYVIDANLQELASIVSLESGKNVSEAVVELREGLEVLRWACGLPYQSRAVQQQLTDSLVCQESRRAVGVVAAITPFNSPGKRPSQALLLASCSLLLALHDIRLTTYNLSYTHTTYVTRPITYTHTHTPIHP
jgi:malonate-semialdehyde dehydrogenase (acetylating)/methylmalonate-semialdehyde dehydrogenase